MGYNQVVETQTMVDLNRRASDILMKTFLSGRRCFIIAGGPSLRNKFDFTPLRKELTIGMNRGFESYSTTIWHARDDDFYNDVVSGYYDKKDNSNVREKFDNFPGTKVFLAQPARIVYGHGCCVVNRLYREIISYDIALGIYPGNNSTFSSIMLAISLGCKEIYLIGVDMKVTTQTHWHQGYDHTLENFTERCKLFKKEIQEWAPKFATGGIKITQLYIDSPEETSLDCFELRKFSSVIGI